MVFGNPFSDMLALSDLRLTLNDCILHIAIDASLLAR
jgi:hypothetical protein